MQNRQLNILFLLFLLNQASRWSYDFSDETKQYNNFYVLILYKEGFTGSVHY